MANTITLKRRIASVRSTRQITKAMELVAASKMRRAQDYARAGRPYHEAAYWLMQRLAQATEVAKHPLFLKRPVKNRLYLVITSNRGLAGAYNANVLRLLHAALQKDQSADIVSRIIAIGGHGARFARRLEGVELVAVYSDFTDHPPPAAVRPILETTLAMYLDGRADRVLLLYTHFESNLVQRPVKHRLLPAESSLAAAAMPEPVFEPSIEEVLNAAAARLVEAQIWQALLEGLASEQSMRMLAMKNASDNAADLIDDLSLAYNTARQAAITQELAEITGGVEALK